MARMKSKLLNSGTVGGVKRTFSQTVTKQFSEIIDLETTYDYADPYLIHTLSPSSKGSFILDDFKQMSIINTGEVVAEVVFQMQSYYDNGSDADITTGDQTNVIEQPYVSWLLRPSEFITLPNPRAVIYHNETASPESAGTASFSNEASLEGATDATGYMTSADMFGETDTDGIVPGSYWIRFYSAGYQELGMTNTTNKRPRQTNSTSTGLAVGTAYEFKIAVDAGASTRISFTTDASNVNWGGTTGVLAKIQATLTGFYNDGTLASHVRVRLSAQGDVRFTSGSRLAASAIALAVGSTGTAEFFGTGTIPAIGDIESATAAALETDTALNLPTGSTSHILRDNGSGILNRPLGGGGTIDYDGAITLRGCPPNAQFKQGFYYNSGHSGSNFYSGTHANIIYRIFGRSTNYKIQARIRIVGFN